MTVVRIPTPLRPYAENQKEVSAGGDTVAAALEHLAARFPALRPHLFDGDGRLRSYVNVFVNDQDIRGLQGEATPVSPTDRLMIVPSIAGGGEPGPLSRVDHAALRTNQAVIIGSLIGAYVADAPWLVLLVGLLMLRGSARRSTAFAAVYAALRNASLLRPDVLSDHPEPHRFAQFVGGIVLTASAVAFAAGAATIGWILSAVVVALAALNLFVGVCVGCALYYWLARLHLPGFSKSPPPGTRPGRRPAG